MATETELMKNILAAAGGDIDSLPDNLKTTIMKAICACMGGGGNGQSGATVLWENPSPTTRVDEGNGLYVSADISPYSIIQILFRRSTTKSTLYSGWMLSIASECTTPFTEVQADDVGQITITSGSAWAGYSNGQFEFWGASYTTNQSNNSNRWTSSNYFSGDDMIPVMIIGY